MDNNTMSTIFTDPSEIEKLNNQVLNEENENPVESIAPQLEKAIKNNVESNIEKDIEFYPGYVNIPLRYLPSNGIFYPNDTKILIRSLTTKEIKYFSGVSEDDQIDINHRLNWILHCGVKIVSTKFPNITFNNLLQLDRFSLILSIRELTFTEFPANLITKCQCSKCNNIQDVEIISNRVGFLREETFKDLENTFSDVYKSFSFNKNGELLNIWYPSVYNSDFISNYLSQHKVSDEDKNIIVKIPYLISPLQKITDEIVIGILKESDNWSVWKYSTMIRFIEHLENNYALNIYYKCSNQECGAEVATPFTFPGGFKGLFIPMLSDLIS